MMAMRWEHLAQQPRRARALLDRAAAPLLATVVALVGLQQTWAGVAGSTAPTLLQTWLPDDLIGEGRLVVTLTGLLLIVVARGLAQRRREAWAWACGLLSLSALAGLVVADQGAASVGPVGALAALALLRGSFVAMADAAQVRRRHLAGAGALALAACYTLTGQLLLAAQLAPRPTPAVAVGAIIPLLSASELPYRTLTPQAAWFVSSVPAVGGVMLLYAVVVALRPAMMRVRRRGERARAGQLLERYGRTALSPFVLAADKSYVWHPERPGVVAYAVAGGVAVACGEPTCEVADRVALVRHFQEMCRRRGLTPALYQAGADLVPAARALGFSALKIGEEAVLDLADFSVQGKRRANVRHAATRAERDGLAVRFFDAGVDAPAILEQLSAISAAWLHGRRLKELGFSMNGFAAERLRTQRAAVAVDPAGRVQAFITFLPTYADGGMALDLMRRAPEAAPGVMELLLVRSAVHLRAQGYTYLSLGLAPLAGLDGVEHGLAGKGLAFLFRNLDGIYRYRSLYRFKDKFAPRWEERYLLYPGPLALPAVLYALARVHVGGGRAHSPAPAEAEPAPPVPAATSRPPGGPVTESAPEDDAPHAAHPPVRAGKDGS